MKKGANETASEKQAVSATWRDLWFVKNVIAELPLVDGVCTSDKGEDIAYQTSRTLTVVVISTAVMMANIFSLDRSDAMIVKAAKTAAGMSLGMSAGGIFHNVATLFFNKVKAAHAHRDAPLLENFLDVAPGPGPESTSL